MAKLWWMFARARPRMRRRSKSEVRNPKFETNSNFQKIKHSTMNLSLIFLDAGRKT